MNFIKANDKYINLKNVSSISILRNRIAFDFNCPVELDDGKMISYYAYNDFNDNDPETEIQKLKNNKYIKDNFIDTGSILVNLNEIAAIKFDDSLSRIIINLSHSIISPGFNKKRLTSKFIYIDKDVKTYESLKETIKSKIGM